MTSGARGASFIYPGASDLVSRITTKRSFSTGSIAGLDLGAHAPRLLQLLMPSIKIQGNKDLGRLQAKLERVVEECNHLQQIVSERSAMIKDRIGSFFQKIHVHRPIGFVVIEDNAMSRDTAPSPGRPVRSGQMHTPTT
jgi:hypothetical protein